jgi:uncharacterized Tic20 family protein
MNIPSSDQQAVIRSPSPEQCWAAGSHAASLLGFVIPFGNIVGPLAVWLIKKDQFPAVNSEGKDAINFQINANILTFALWLLVMLSAFVPVALVLITPIAIVAGYAPILWSAIKAYKVYQNEAFKYPPTYQFLR